MAEELGGQVPGWRRVMPRGGLLANLGFAAALLALLWVVYAPSLGHTPRADHWDFLLDTMDQDSFLDVFAHSYSYNRTRSVAPGDTVLFRPLLFAVLAAEKAIFATDFAGYQAAGILLHWGVACLLLLLLQAVLAFERETAGTDSPPSWPSRLLPYGVSLFFALNKSVQELVIWSHLHGYLLFLILLLASLTLLLRCALRAATWKSPWLWGSWVLALLSAFTYEMGQFYAVLAGLFLAAALPRGTAGARRLALCGLFAAVLALYQGANRLDRWIHRGQFDPDDPSAHILRGAFSQATVANSGRFLAYTVLQPFFPSLWAGTLVGGHLSIEEIDWGRNPFRSFHLTLGASALTTALGSGLGLFGLVRLARRRDKRSLWMFLLAAGLYGTYLASVVLGRMNPRPCLYLSLNSYYAHTGLLLALVPGSAAWLAVGRGRAGAAGQAALLLGLMALTYHGGLAVWCLTASVAGDLNGCRDGGAGFTRRVARVERFIRQHGGEPDFSLGFDFDSCNAVGTHHGVPVTTILFKRHIRPERPKYVVAFPDGEPSPMAYAEWQRSRGPGGRLCPELVSVGPFYNYFRADGWYYGVQQWDGCYDSSRRDHAYLIRDRTLEGAMRQQPAKLAEQEAYVRGGWFLPPQPPVTLTGRWARGVQLGRGPRRDCLIQPREKWANDLSKVLHNDCSSSCRGSTAAEGKGPTDRAPPAPTERPR
jgi:hypothetical protein